MNFNFFAPTKLITGKDCVTKNADLIKPLGKRCLIVTSKTAGEKSGAINDIKKALESASITYKIHNSVEQNPLLSDAFSCGILALDFGADFIIGVGGGSPLDASKAVSIFAANPDLEMLDIFNMDWKNKPLPVVAIGTTAGTGSEVNGFSVLTKPDGKKQSISHSDCYPIITFGDAKYTYSLPLDFTKSTGLDALAHAIEGYYSTAANRISDMFAIEAIKVLIKTLPELNGLKSEKEIPSSIRENLYYSSVIAGYTLGMCGTLYCHALGYFLSEEHSIAHGYACSIFLPDFLSRQNNLMPEKSVNLEKEIGISLKELANLIKSLTCNINITLSANQIKELVDSKVNTNNFIRTSPNGLSKEEGYEIMNKIFQ